MRDEGGWRQREGRKEREREKKGGEGQVSRFIIPLKGLTTLTTRTSLLPFLLYILRFRIVIPARGGSRESSNSRARHQRSSASYCSLEERLLRLRRFPPVLLCTEGVPPIAGTIENEAENKPRRTRETEMESSFAAWRFSRNEECWRFGNLSRVRWDLTGCSQDTLYMYLGLCRAPSAVSSRCL